MASGAEIAVALSALQARIAAAAARASRAPAAIELIAVSKTRPLEEIRAALAAGQRLFGENYAQELRDKARLLAGETPVPIWHFIGALQRNKVKYVVGTAALIHSVDSVEIAKEIDRRAATLAKAQEILLEVNVAGEAQKHGFAPAALAAVLEEIRTLPQIRCTGLMTMAPLDDDPEQARPYFRALRVLAEQHGLSRLSMGMTQDFEVAIEEGATLLRVGTAIFGAREPG